MAAARRLYGGEGGNQNTLESLGIPAAFATSFEEDKCNIWPQNWQTVQLFAAMGTQWRVGMGGATGLVYASLPIVARGEGIKLTPETIRGIRIMEGAALKCMTDKREQK